MISIRRTVKPLMTPAPRHSARPARTVAERDGCVELHCEAVVLGELVGDPAHRHFEGAIPHPDLLGDGRFARARFIRHPRARGKGSPRRSGSETEVRRRNVPAHISSLRVLPGMRSAACDTGCRAPGVVEHRGERDPETGRDLLEHHGGGAGLAALDQRDHRAADGAPAGERVEAEGGTARSARTRAAIRAFTSAIMEGTSTKLEIRSTRTAPGAPFLSGKPRLELVVQMRFVSTPPRCTNFND